MDWMQTVEKFYKNKKSGNSLSFEGLLEMVSEQMEQPLTEGRKTTEEKFLLSIPKFTPSEAWGQPNSEARKQMENYFKRVGGAGLDGRLNWLKRIQEPPKKVGRPMTPQRVISSLIILESLASCVNDFSESSAGFVFEGFLAALLGGKQISEKRGGNLPIEDIVAFETDDKAIAAGGGKPMSLKLLRESTSIKGSYTNLLDALDFYEKGMLYIIATKAYGEKTEDSPAQVESIAFGRFEITRNNVLQVVSQRSNNIERLLALNPEKSGGHDMSGKEVLELANSMGTWDERYNLLRMTVGYTKPFTDAEKRIMRPQEEPPPKKRSSSTSISRELFNMSTADLLAQGTPGAEQELLRRGRNPKTGKKTRKVNENLYPIVHIATNELLTEEEKTKSQWHLTWADLSRPAMTDIAWTPLGTLNVDAASLQNVVKDYTDILGEQVMMLFETVKDLSDNLNMFFTYENRPHGLARGAKAVKNAESIQKQASAQVESEKSKKLEKT